MDEENFDDLVVRARRGEQAAIRELLNRFEPEVRTMVRIRLPRVMRSRFDSMDFVQAVWQSFFDVEGQGHGPDRFESPGHLRAYLVGIARNKVLEEYRRRTTQKYDIGREEPLYVERRGVGRPAVDVPSHDPTPSQVLAADDRRNRIIAGLSRIALSIVQLREEGLTFEEIAQRTGLGERSVRRVIEDLRRREQERA